MQYAAKYFLTIVFIFFVCSFFKEKSHYIINYVSNIYKKDVDNKEQKNWSTYLTKDYKLVLCNNENFHIYEMKCCSSQFIENLEEYYKEIQINSIHNIKISITNSCMDLLTYIVSDDYKSNINAKIEAIKIFRNKLMMEKNINNILSKTYLELKSDNKVKYDVVLARHKDINIIKKNNIFAITLGDKTINVIFELENLLDSFEREKINTKPHRNYLKMIIDNNKT